MDCHLFAIRIDFWSDTTIGTTQITHHSLQVDKRGLSATLLRAPKYFGADSQPSMYTFVGRKYWYRVWIIQEIAVGVGEIPLLYRQNQIY